MVGGAGGGRPRSVPPWSESRVALIAERMQICSEATARGRENGRDMVHNEFNSFKNGHSSFPHSSQQRGSPSPPSRQHVRQLEIGAARASF